MPNNLMSVISNPKSSGKKLDRLFTIGEDTIQNSQRIYANQKPMGWHLTVENDKVCVRLLKEKYFKRTFPSGHLKPALTLYTSKGICKTKPLLEKFMLFVSPRGAVRIWQRANRSHTLDTFKPQPCSNVLLDIRMVADPHGK